jgi:N-acylneuraminate cytidylyltransferase
MKSVCVIPARGGSKRIPHKNIRSFCGRPIIAWSIDAALASGVFDEVVISTDDPAIADVGRALGAQVPFMRPAELSDDHTGTVEVIQHAIAELEAQGRQSELVCCLYATAPFVTAEALREARSRLVEGKWEYAFPVCTFDFPVQRALRLSPTGGVESRWPEFALSRSQDLEELVHDAGQFYWGKADAWRAGRPVYGLKSTSIRVSRAVAQDIDTEEDWEIAEALFQLRAPKTPS